MIKQNHFGKIILGEKNLFLGELMFPILPGNQMLIKILLLKYSLYFILNFNFFSSLFNNI